jgi:hypothetical protein
MLSEHQQTVDERVRKLAQDVISGYGRREGIRKSLERQN